MGGAGAAAAAAGTCPSSLATAGPLESPAVATQAATAGAGARSSFGNMNPDPLTHPLTMTLGLMTYLSMTLGFASAPEPIARAL